MSDWQAADADHVLISESVASAYAAHRDLPPPAVRAVPAKGKPAGVPCARFHWRTAAFADWPPPPPPPALPRLPSLPALDDRRARAAPGTESWFPAAPAGPAASGGDWASPSQAGTPRSADSGWAEGGEWGDGAVVLGACRGGGFSRLGNAAVEGMEWADLGEVSFYS
jgi:hypothetical protein